MCSSDLSIKSSMRMMGMQELVNKLNAMMDQPSEDPSSTTRHGTPLRGTFEDPVPAQRDDVYEAQLADISQYLASLHNHS